jgi:hypothetical protein
MLCALVFALLAGRIRSSVDGGVVYSIGLSGSFLLLNLLVSISRLAAFLAEVD